MVSLFRSSYSLSLRHLVPLGASTRKMVTLERNTRLSYLAVYSSDCLEMFDIEDPHSNTGCRHELMGHMPSLNYLCLLTHV